MPLRALLFVTALLIAGCSANRIQNPFEGGSATGRQIRVHVENRDFNEATLYSVSRNPRRIGTVTGKGSATFPLGWTNTNDLRIRIQVLAGGEYTTNRVSVSPGEEVYLVIAQPLYRSMLRK